MSPVERAELGMILRGLDLGPATLGKVQAGLRVGKKGSAEPLLLRAIVVGFATVAFHTRGEPHYCLTPMGVDLLDSLDDGEAQEKRAS